MAARRPPVVGIRSALIGGLAPLLPRGWKLHPYRKAPDAINQTTVWVKLGSIEKLPEAPVSGVNLITYTVTVAVPEADFADADERLDMDVITLTDALDALPMVRRARADAVAVADLYLGYDISVEVITQPIKE